MRQVVNLQTGEITFEEDAPVTPQTAEEIASQLQNEVNSVSLAYLASTDWMITRMAENGTPVLIDVLAKRQEARNAIV